MGYNRVLLEIDKYKEEKAEEDAYQAFMKDVGEWGADFKMANLLGGIAGAAVSFVTPFNPAFGYLAGSTIGTLGYYDKHKDDAIMNMEDFDEVLAEYNPELRSKFDSGYEGEIDAEMADMAPTWMDPFNMIFENVVNYVKMGGDFNILDEGAEWSAQTGFTQTAASGASGASGGSIWDKLGNQLGFSNPLDGDMETFANAAGIQESAMYSVDATTGVGEWVFESGEPVAEVMQPEGMKTYDMSDPNLTDGMSFDWSRYEKGLSAPFSEQLQGYQDTFDEWLNSQDVDYQEIIQDSKWYNQ